MQIKPYRKNKKPIGYIYVAILVLAVAGYLGYAYATKNTWPFVKAPETEKTTNGINYAPPTEQEVDTSQDAKRNAPNDSKAATNVSVGISYAGKSQDGASIEINAYTTSVIEGTGTCTATLTKGPDTFTASTKAFIDASSTICEPVIIPLSQFGSEGVWKLLVTYESGDHTGKSPVIEVTI